MLSRLVIRQGVQKRCYSASSVNGGGSAYYRYGTPIVKCTVVASATALAWQLLWQHLEYQEYREEAEDQITRLEGRIKSLEQGKDDTAAR